MAHFAKVENGIVARVIVAEQDVVDALVETVPGFWVQTSYNTRGGVHYEPNSDTPSADQSKALRKNFAGVNFTYDATRDAFIPPKPFESWTLNEDTCLWEAPTPKPEDGKFYFWDEVILSWVEAGSV
jgi:hypothetical protein